ncbi:hypothetical protein VF11_37320 [Nostoc linckia z14]|nr:hypothetical protein Ddc_23286 [Ditylenchus destructor]PHK08673.1 hypothetical protein VF11_37320 [Nostoc linckia z14]
MMRDQFEELIRAEQAAPSSAMEYRSTLVRLLKGKSLTPISCQASQNSYIFETKGDFDFSHIVEFPLYADGQESDIYGVFRIKISRNEPPSVHLYDILVP